MQRRLIPLFLSVSLRQTVYYCHRLLAKLLTFFAIQKPVGDKSRGRLWIFPYLQYLRELTWALGCVSKNSHESVSSEEQASWEFFKSSREAWGVRSKTPMGPSWVQRRCHGSFRELPWALGFFSIDVMPPRNKTLVSHYWKYFQPLFSMVNWWYLFRGWVLAPGCWGHSEPRGRAGSCTCGHPPPSPLPTAC